MVDKKAFIRTIEAVIAITILLIIVYAFIPRNVKTDSSTPTIVSAAQNIIIKEIIHNETIRSGILDSGISNCNSYTKLTEGIFKKHLPAGYTFVCEICDTPICISNLTPFDRSVYMADMLIASTSINQDPKILRFWIWKPSS